MRRRLPLLGALLAGAAIAVVAVLLLTGGDGGGGGSQPPAALADGEELRGPGGSFTMRYPQGWRRLSADELRPSGEGQAAPVAGVQRGRGGAVLLVERRGRLETPLDELEPDLTRRLRASIRDFRFVSSDQVALPAGQAVSYTFIRTRTGQVQNLVVIPKGDQTFTLNSVIGGQQRDAAREVAQMVRSFEVEEG